MVRAMQTPEMAVLYPNSVKHSTKDGGRARKPEESQSMRDAV